MKSIRIIKFVPGIAWFFIALVLLCMPSDNIPEVNWLDKIFFDKWVHFGVFGLLALLFMLPVAFAPMDSREKLHYFIRVALATSVWGLSTEFIQKYMVTGRSFDLWDWAADSLGALAALIYCKIKYG